MHWLLFGPSGRRKRPQNAGVLRSYIQCRQTATALVKSIANTYFLANIVGNPHTFEYKFVSAPLSVDLTSLWSMHCSMISPKIALKSAASCASMVALEATLVPHVVLYDLRWLITYGPYALHFQC